MSLRWLQNVEQEPLGTIEPDETNSNMLSAAVSNVLLFFLIFGLSATVDLTNLKRQFSNRFAIGCGVCMQFIVMPLTGYAAVMLLKDTTGFTQAMGITLLVVTSSPGGSYSNWWCSMFNADLALSVAMTTVSSLLSTGLLPANLLLYTYLAYGVAEETSVVEALDFKTLFITLGLVLAAIILGLAAGGRWDTPAFHKWANKFGSVCGLLLVVFSVFLSSGGDGAESKLWNQEWSFYVGTAFPCLVGLVLASILARFAGLSPPETVTIAIECCYQNTGIATSVAISMFSDREERAQAVAVPLFYGLVEAVAIGLYCVGAWKVGWTKAPKDEAFCTMIVKSYEIEEEEEDDNDDDTSNRVDEEHALETKIDLLVGTGVDDGVQAEAVLLAANRRNEKEAVSPGFWGRLLPFGPRRQRTESQEDLVTGKADTPTSTPPKRTRFNSTDTAADTTTTTSSSSNTANSSPYTPRYNSNRHVIDPAWDSPISMTIPEASMEMDLSASDLVNPNPQPPPPPPASSL